MALSIDYKPVMCVLISGCRADLENGESNLLPNDATLLGIKVIIQFLNGCFGLSGFVVFFALS